MLLGRPGLFKVEQVIDPLGIGPTKQQHTPRQPADYRLLILTDGKQRLGHIISGLNGVRRRNFLQFSLDRIGQIFFI